MEKINREELFISPSVMVTGGTGSFGREFISLLLNSDICPRKVIVFSRDEFKQHEMREQFPDDRLRFFIGDVRDLARLNMAMKKVDWVVHAAALKQVPVCEYNPDEAVKTNILGTQNVIKAAINNRVGKVIALSTDKAVNPINLYGATKMVAEKMLINANAFSNKKTAFSVVRYGNILGSRGSVVQTFMKHAETGEVPITDKQMTRFWWTIDKAAQFVYYRLLDMIGGEIFVPVLNSSYVKELIAVLCPECRIKTIGIRPGEKLHECLIAPDEKRRTMFISLNGEMYYYIRPEGVFDFKKEVGSPTMARTDYTSDNCLVDNRTEWLIDMLKGVK